MYSLGSPDFLTLSLVFMMFACFIDSKSIEKACDISPI
jgi:hypothetical protein